MLSLLLCWYCKDRYFFVTLSAQLKKKLKKFYTLLKVYLYCIIYQYFIFYLYYYSILSFYVFYIIIIYYTSILYYGLYVFGVFGFGVEIFRLLAPSFYIAFFILLVVAFSPLCLCVFVVKKGCILGVWLYICE